MKKIAGMKKVQCLIISLCIAIMCFGCKGGSHEITETKNENGNVTEVSEALMDYFNSLTDAMLDSCNTYPALDSYWNDSLVLLNEFNNDIRLYGISAGEESAMLLYINDEKVLLNHAFKNLYQELPKLNNADIDNDGSDEIIISLRTGTGSPQGNMYALLVCDYDTAWNIYEYDDFVQDIDAFIDYRYNEASNTIIFSHDTENILISIQLPEWTVEHPYEGTVNLEGNLRFDAETMQMEVTPCILLKDSLPYSNVTMVFTVGYANGDFEIKYDYYMAAGESENQGELIAKYLDAYVELDADTKIESTEWIEHDTKQCLRIRIQYKVQPEGKYKHKEDYFLFCNTTDEVINVLHVDYADIELGSGNDFNAHFEDVTFDGNEDLLIHIGSGGSDQYYCAFIYENGNYRREESFEAIPDYEVNADKRQIVGSADSIDTETIIKYVYDNGKFECMDRVTNNK